MLKVQKKAEDERDSPCRDKFKATEEKIRALLVNLHKRNKNCTVSGNIKQKRGSKTKTIIGNESSSSSDGEYDESEGAMSWEEDLEDDQCYGLAIIIIIIMGITITIIAKQWTFWDHPKFDFVHQPVFKEKQTKHKE